VTRRLLAAPDKFRGTATAAAIARAIADGARLAGWEPVERAVSDGGEGFVAAVAPDGEGRREIVGGPLGEPVEAEWRFLDDGATGTRTAVIEAASACGLVLAGGPALNDPMQATTFGVGQLILAAAASGASRVILGCGGSATTDGGKGAIEALGRTELPELLVACDVETTFVEAASEFAPQKGATAEQVEMLGERLRRLARSYEDTTGVAVDRLVGGGAAGGLGGGLASLGAVLRPGFEIVLDATDLAAEIGRAQVVVTGEGKLDGASWRGKVVGGISRAAAVARSSEPPTVLCVAGQVTAEGAKLASQHGLHVIDLQRRFGEKRSLSDVERLVTLAVAEWLEASGLPGPRAERFDAEP
jgi:glycerate kinase